VAVSLRQGAMKQQFQVVSPSASVSAAAICLGAPERHEVAVSLRQGAMNPRFQVAVDPAAAPSIRCLANRAANAVLNVPRTRRPDICQ
jgi:hypothetical protein